MKNQTVMNNYYILYDTLTKKYQVFQEHPVYYEDILVGEWESLEAAEEFIYGVTYED